MNNLVVPNYFAEAQIFEYIHTMIYYAATGVVRVMGINVTTQHHQQSKKRVQNAYLGKDEAKRLRDYHKRVWTRKLKKRVQGFVLLQGLKLLSMIFVYSGLLRRYKASNSRRKFEQSGRSFYRKLNSNE